MIVTNRPFLPMQSRFYRPGRSVLYPCCARPASIAGRHRLASIEMCVPQRQVRLLTQSAAAVQLAARRLERVVEPSCITVGKRQ